MLFLFEYERRRRFTKLLFVYSTTKGAKVYEVAFFIRIRKGQRFTKLLFVYSTTKGNEGLRKCFGIFDYTIKRRCEVKTFTLNDSGVELWSVRCINGGSVKNTVLFSNYSILLCFIRLFFTKL